MGNQAIDVNGHPIPHAVNNGVSDIGITTRGSSWYFVSQLIQLTAMSTVSREANDHRRCRP